MGEDEGRTDDIADLAGADGDVPQGTPALVKQGEPAFAEAAQGALSGVVGTGADVEFASAGWRLTGV
jgi:hypothetical protein